MKKFKITPLFIVLVVLEIMFLFLTFYYTFIENGNGMALGAVIAFIAASLNFVIIVIEQAITNIKRINKNFLWTIEIVLIVAGIIYVATNGISIG